MMMMKKIIFHPFIELEFWFYDEKSTHRIFRCLVSSNNKKILYLLHKTKMLKIIKYIIHIPFSGYSANILKCIQIEQENTIILSNNYFSSIINWTHDLTMKLPKLWWTNHNSWPQLIFLSVCTPSFCDLNFYWLLIDR